MSTTLEAVAQATGGGSSDPSAGTVAILIAGISALATVVIWLYTSGQKQAKEARGERDALVKEISSMRETHAKAWHDRELAFEKAMGSERLLQANEVSRVRAEYENRIKAMEVGHETSLACEVRERVEAGEREAARASIEREKMGGALGAIAVTLGKIETHIDPQRTR